jgi:hypothetical protein
MKWIVGVLVALVSLTACAQTSTVEESSAFEELADGSCNSEESRLVQEHVSGQITALSKEDWESAYSYAAPGFQEIIGLDQFIFVITSQYQMLISNESVKYGACDIVNKEITQLVNVTSENNLFELTYSLSHDGQALGIESATTVLREPQTTI